MEIGAGECRSNPPTHEGWPAVKADGWCGCHVLHPESEEAKVEQRVRVEAATIGLELGREAALAVNLGPCDCKAPCKEWCPRYEAKLDALAKEVVEVPEGALTSCPECGAFGGAHMLGCSKWAHGPEPVQEASERATHYATDFGTVELSKPFEEREPMVASKSLVEDDIDLDMKPVKTHGCPGCYGDGSQHARWCHTHAGKS